VHQRDVDLAGAQGVGDQGRVQLGDHRLQTRVPARQLHERGRDHRAAGRGERADAHRPGQPVPRAGQVGRRLLQPPEHVFGVPHQRERGRGERHPAAGAFQQRHPGLPFERAQLLRDGGGRVAQRVGHGGDRAAQGELAQQAQAADVEHQVSLRSPQGA